MTLNAPKPTHTLASLGLASALLFTPGYAVSAPHHDHAALPAYSNSSVLTAQAKAATSDVIDTHRQWAKSPGAVSKRQNLNNLIAEVEVRRNLLAELIKSNPAEAVNVALSDDLRDGMPEEIRVMLEQKVQVEGVLEAVYEDFADGSYKLTQYLNTSKGGRFEIHAGTQLPTASNGKRVRINALMLANIEDDTSTDGSIALASSEDLLVLAADGGSTGGSNGGIAGASSSSIGEHRVAVMMVNFQNAPNEKPWSGNQFRDVIFGDVNDFYKEMSYNQTSLSGDVLGWYTIPVDGGSCPGFQDLTNAAAEADGVDLSGYDHLVYVLAPSSGCSTNMGSVGGAPSWSRIVTGPDFDGISHELGHNYGLYHSHAYKCNGGAVLDSSCSSSEYGDEYDQMGAADSGHFNAFQKERLGWVGNNQSSSVTEVVSDGLFTISPMSDSSSGTKVLKILRGNNSSTGQQDWYYLEYRQPVGFDAGLFEIIDSYSRPDNLANGVVVHAATEGDANSSYLLDMTPDSIIRSTGLDLRDAALEVGQSYYDDLVGVTITPVSNNANGITLSVSFDGGNGGGSTNTAPVASNDSASTAENTAVTISALGNDYDADGDSLTITGTSGVNGSAHVSGGNITYTPNTAYTGTETFTYTISDGNGGTDSATITVTVVASPVNSEPVAVNDSAATTEGTSITIPVLSNDYDPDGDSISISGTSGVNGLAQVSGGNIIFTPATGFSGTETFNYTLSDGNGGTDSATVTVTVTASSTNNNAPVAVNDTVEITSVTSITFNVLSNDYDAENDTLNVVGVTQGSKGHVAFNADGTLTYTPGKRFKNSDSFSYTINDGKTSATGSVTIKLASSGSKGKGNGKKN